jgi:two-component system cell cycle response regulator DivK
MVMNEAGRKIVIFDDDEDILSICTYILESQGWSVTSFTDCNDPVERIAIAQPDVVLMDNWIPDEGGIIATQKLKLSAYSHIPVVYFSANKDVRLLARSAGADQFIAKPFDIEELKRVLEKVLQGH